MAITSYLLNKRVSWYELQKVIQGYKIDYQRVFFKGTVEHVSDCGGMCRISGDDGEVYDIETQDLSIIE